MLDEVDAHAAGIEDDDGLRLRRADLRDLCRVIELAHGRVDLARNIALVVALDAGEHVLASGIVGRHHVDVLQALVLQVLADAFIVGVVLERRREEMRMALLAGDDRGASIGRYVEGAGIEHGLHDGEQHVREVNAGDDVHAVAFEHLVDHLATDVGLHLVIAPHHLDIAAAKLVAGMLEGELEAIGEIAAKHAFGARHAGYEADLDRRLGEGRARSQREGTGGSHRRQSKRASHS